MSRYQLSDPPSPSSPVCYFDFDDYKKTRKGALCENLPPSPLSSTLSSFPKPPVSPIRPVSEIAGSLNSACYRKKGIPDHVKKSSYRHSVSAEMQQKQQHQPLPPLVSSRSAPPSPTWSEEEEEEDEVGQIAEEAEKTSDDVPNPTSTEKSDERATIKSQEKPQQPAKEEETRVNDKDAATLPTPKAVEHLKVPIEKSQLSSISPSLYDEEGAIIEEANIVVLQPAPPGRKRSPSYTAPQFLPPTPPTESPPPPLSPPLPTPPPVVSIEKAALDLPPADADPSVVGLGGGVVSGETTTTPVRPIIEVLRNPLTNTLHRSDLPIYSTSHVCVVAASSLVGTESVLHDLVASPRGVSVSVSGSPSTRNIYKALELCTPPPLPDGTPQPGGPGILVIVSNYAGGVTAAETAIEKYNTKHGLFNVALVMMDEDLTIGNTVIINERRKKGKNSRGLSAYLMLLKISTYLASNDGVTLEETRDAVEEVKVGLGAVSVVRPNHHHQSHIRSMSAPGWNHAASGGGTHSRTGSYASRTSSVASVRSDSTLYPHEEDGVDFMTPSPSELVKAMVSLLLDRSADGTSFVDVRRGDSVVVFVDGASDVDELTEVAKVECEGIGVTIEVLVEGHFGVGGSADKSGHGFGFGVLRLPRVRRGLLSHEGVLMALEDGLEVELEGVMEMETVKE